MRSQPADTSEQVSQLLFGEHFKVLEQRKYWSYVRHAFDKCEGWIDNRQLLLIPEDTYKALDLEETLFSDNLVDYVSDGINLIPIVLGSHVNATRILNYDEFEGHARKGVKNREEVIRSALFYLNTPYCWGGRSPFGLDCSGFTQMVYKLNGYKLLRDAEQQASQGEPLSFIEESEQGDLAFFDNEEGKIIHVGIIMKDNYLIHAHGKVRIDRIDHTGIFNTEMGLYSHKLRVIKRIIP